VKQARSPCPRLPIAGPCRCCRAARPHSPRSSCRACARYVRTSKRRCGQPSSLLSARGRSRPRHRRRTSERREFTVPRRITEPGGEACEPARRGSAALPRTRRHGGRRRFRFPLDCLERQGTCRLVVRGSGGLVLPPARRAAPLDDETPLRALASHKTPSERRADERVLSVCLRRVCATAGTGGAMRHHGRASLRSEPELRPLCATA